MILLDRARAGSVQTPIDPRRDPIYTRRELQSVDRSDRGEPQGDNTASSPASFSSSLSASTGRLRILRRGLAIIERGGGGGGARGLSGGSTSTTTVYPGAITQSTSTTRRRPRTTQNINTPIFGSMLDDNEDDGDELAHFFERSERVQRRNNRDRLTGSTSSAASTTNLAVASTTIGEEERGEGEGGRSGGHTRNLSSEFDRLGSSSTRSATLGLYPDDDEEPIGARRGAVEFGTLLPDGSHPRANAAATNNVGEGALLDPEIEQFGTSTYADVARRTTRRLREMRESMQALSDRVLGAERSVDRRTVGLRMFLGGESSTDSGRDFSNASLTATMPPTAPLSPAPPPTPPRAPSPTLNATFTTPNTPLPIDPLTAFTTGNIFSAPSLSATAENPPSFADIANAVSVSTNIRVDDTNTSRNHVDDIGRSPWASLSEAAARAVSESNVSVAVSIVNENVGTPTADDIVRSITPDMRPRRSPNLVPGFGPRRQTAAAPATTISTHRSRQQHHHHHRRSSSSSSSNSASAIVIPDSQTTTTTVTADGLVFRERMGRRRNTGERRSGSGGSGSAGGGGGGAAR